MSAKTKIIPMKESPVVAIRQRIQAIWDGSAQNEEVEAVLNAILDDVETLDKALRTSERAQAAARTLISSMREQRDLAIDTAGKQIARATNDVDFYRRKGQAVAYQTLVATIAEAVRCEEEDVKLLLDAMSNDQFIDGYALRQIKDAIQRAAHNLNSL